MSVLYDRIHSLCELKGVKDGTMCREANVPRSTFQELKMGRTENLSLKTLQKIADYFGVSVSELTGEDQKEKPSTPEDAERESHGKAILNKYNMLDPATQAMFESMLDAAIAAQEKKNGQ